MTFMYDNSKLHEKWEQTLTAYLESQGARTGEFRQQPQGSHPWPDVDNPMLPFLLERTTELVEEIGPDEALLWLAVHAWFEGAIMESASSNGPEGG